MIKSKKQNIIFVAIACVTLAALSVIVMFFSGKFDFAAPEKKGYQNITFTDASIACEKEARDEFGKELKQLFVDNHSSRFEHDAYLYKIFLQAYTSEKKKAVEYYVSCYVKSSNGRISKFDISENKDEDRTGGAIKKSADKLIDWPQ